MSYFGELSAFSGWVEREVGRLRTAASAQPAKLSTL
jgi:hypothetical protein